MTSGKAMIGRDSGVVAGCPALPGLIALWESGRVRCLGLACCRTFGAHKPRIRWSEQPGCLRAELLTSIRAIILYIWLIQTPIRLACFKDPSVSGEPNRRGAKLARLDPRVRAAGRCFSGHGIRLILQAIRAKHPLDPRRHPLLLRSSFHAFHFHSQ